MSNLSSQLRTLGWNGAYEQQLTLDDLEQAFPARVAAHWGSQLLCLAAEGEQNLPIGLTRACGDLAVGDWILLDQETGRGVRRLERTSLLARKAPGERAELQPIAANLDTLLVVSSCNNDFSLPRLERYLALAADAEIEAIVVLTKADQCEDPAALRQQAERIKTGLIVEAIDARDPCQVQTLEGWCRVGKTVALVGSSGVGKSTLAMTLGAGELATQAIREDDSRGRHTTTARAIHRLAAGGLLIDTPGMRELQLADCETGLAEVFEDVLELAEQCRYRDCGHRSEPGCAVQAAIDAGTLDPRRLKSYAKLQAEQARNAQSLHERREASRKQGQMYKAIQSAKRKRQE